MTRLQKILFGVLFAAVALLAVRSIKMQQQLIIAKENQDAILQVLIQMRIIDGVQTQ